MVWASLPRGSEGTDHTRVLRYVQFRIVLEGFPLAFTANFGNLGEIGYSAFGPPSVVYKGATPSDPSAFILAWKNPGRCFYTLRKSVSEADTFNTIKGVCAGTGTFVHNPMLGADNTGVAELWVTGNIAP